MMLAVGMAPLGAVTAAPEPWRMGWVRGGMLGAPTSHALQTGGGAQDWGWGSWTKVNSFGSFLPSAHEESSQMQSTQEKPKHLGMVPRKSTSAGARVPFL